MINEKKISIELPSKEKRIPLSIIETRLKLLSNLSTTFPDLYLYKNKNNSSKNDIIALIDVFPTALSGENRIYQEIIISPEIASEKRDIH